MGIISGLLGKAGIVPNEKLRADYGRLLAPEERIEVGCRLVRDTFIFTSHRIILVDVQGVTGKKTEYASIPYSKITRFSIETAGHFDLDAELKIWVGSDPNPIEKRFNKQVDIYEIQKVLASHLA